MRTRIGCAKARIAARSERRDVGWVLISWLIELPYNKCDMVIRVLGMSLV